jgi:hypothetical protein
MYGLNGDGSAIGGFPVEIGNSVNSSPVIADVDGDGQKEIIVAATDGVLYGFNADGTGIANFPVPLYGTLTTSSVAVGDIDGDNDLEFAVGLRQGFDNLVVIDFKQESALQGWDWRMYGHDITRSHRWFDWFVGIPEEDEQALPLVFGLSQNYPNPFNPDTKIMYSLSEGSYVRMTVYNILGQEVTWLVDGYENAGRYEVTWDGRSESGRSVASGIYFYKLETDKKSAVKRMLLMK